MAASCSSSPVGTLSNSFHGRSRVSHDLRFRQGRQLAGALKDAPVDYDRIDIFGERGPDEEMGRIDKVAHV
jgi:hypothetical protein